MLRSALRTRCYVTFPQPSTLLQGVSPLLAKPEPIMSSRAAAAAAGISFDQRAAQRLAKQRQEWRQLREKFITITMRRGQKATIDGILKKAFAYIKEIEIKRARAEGVEPKTALEIFGKGMENIMPVVECRGVKRGGATYQVPYPLSVGRRRFLGVHFVLSACKQRGDQSLAKLLAEEVTHGYRYEGLAMKKRTELHKLAESNRAYSHYRWG